MSKEELAVSLTIEEWKVILKWLEKMPVDPNLRKNFRMSFTMSFYLNEIEKMKRSANE